MSTLRKPFFLSLIALTPSLVTVAGCTALPSIADTPARLAASAGTRDAITFSSIGEPIDVRDEAADRAALTLPEAIELSVRHSPAVQSAIARVRVALADARQTRLLPNPVLSVVVRFPDGGGKPDIEAGLAAELLSLLQRPRQMNAADARVRAAACESLVIVLDLVAEVQSTFLAIQTFDADRATLMQRRGLIDRLESIADARLKAGEAGRLDVLTLRGQRAELDAELIENEADGIDRRLALARLIGRPSSGLEWTLAGWTPPTIVGDERTWIAMALEHRPELQAQRWELIALGDEQALARFAFTEGSAGVAAERDDGWSVGPGIDIALPVFDWGQARRDRATAQVIAGRHQFTQTARQVVEDVRRAWAATEAARRLQTAVESDLLPLQEQRRAQAETQYRNGAADITALLVAEQDALAGRLKLVQAQSRLALAHVRLQRAVGGANAATSASTPRPATTVPTH